MTPRIIFSVEPCGKEVEAHDCEKDELRIQHWFS